MPAPDAPFTGEIVYAKPLHQDPETAHIDLEPWVMVFQDGLLVANHRVIVFPVQFYREGDWALPRDVQAMLGFLRDPKNLPPDSDVPQVH